MKIIKTYVGTVGCNKQL